MTSPTLNPAWSGPGGGEGEAGPGLLVLSPSGWASFLAGALSAFTLQVVGEMPVGELVLVGAVGWAAACAACRGSPPGPLLRSGLLKGFLAAQAVAFAAYVVSDGYRGSAPHDILRGWSRMVFLAIDIVAAAYLFGRARRNVAVLLVGICAGNTAAALIGPGPLFGDMWKFGVGVPLTIVVVLVLSRFGALAAAAAAAGMGVVHLARDYRSFGGFCFAVAALTIVQRSSRRLRFWVAPLAAAAAVAAVAGYYATTAADRNGQRETRSDVEREAMMQAAAEAFEKSPLIGQGSWFSKSDFYDNFLVIRRERAGDAGVGGFASDPNIDPGNLAIHSQILDALAEGGLFGGAFFLLYGAMLLWAVWEEVFERDWHPLAPMELFVCVDAVWDLLLSPFSGAHRIDIAMASGLVLLLWEERRERRAWGAA